MSAKYIDVHPENPQSRFVSLVAGILSKGGIIAYPTSSGYALGCKLGNAVGLDRIRKIRGLSEKQDFTLMCSDISQASVYAQVDNNAFKVIKRSAEGRFTFILPTTHELPRKAHSKRSTVGVRIASYKFVKMLLEELGEPILSTSLLIPKNDADDAEILAFSDGWSVKETLDNQVDAIVDAGEISSNPTTLVDFISGETTVR